MTNYFHHWVERSSIQQKIMALLMVGIIGIGSISFAVSFITLRNILTQRICETNQSTTEIMANRIDELFASSTTAVVGISIDQRIQENVGTLYSGDQVEIIHAINTLKDLLSNYTYSIVNKPASIALLTEDGTLIYNGDSFSHPGNAFLQQVYADYMAQFSLGSVPRRSPIKEYLPNPLSAQPADDVYCIAMPVRSPDAQYSALVLMLIRTQYMTPYLEVGDEEYHTRVLADETGKIVISPDASLVGQDLADFTHGSSLPQSGKSIRIDDSYLFCEKLDSFSGTVYDKMNTSYIDSQLWMVARRLLFLDLVAVAVMSMIARAISNSITRPLVRLSEKMSEREYTALANDSDLHGRNEVLVLEYSFSVMQENIRELMAANIQKEQEKRKTEIQALQSQIRPHFLFNTLNTVRYAIQNNNNQKAQDMILALSGLLRMTLVKGDELLPLWEELQTLQYYQNIMLMRTSMHFDTFYQIEPVLEQFLLPKLLLQPLVENCILHGFKCRKKDGMICISAVTEPDGVHIIIVDNGGMLHQNESAPVRRHSSDSFSGIGLENIKRRIQLYYGEKATLELYSIGDTYTAAELALPFAISENTAPIKEIHS